MPPIDLSKKKIVKPASKKLPVVDLNNSNLQIVEEISLPSSLVKEIKKIYEIKRIRYADTLLRPQVTPKKLLEVRNRSTNPYISLQGKDEKKESGLRESFRPNSLKPFTARNDERKKVDCIFSNLAYM